VNRTILITEFMDEAAVGWLRARFSVDYDPTLADDRPRLLGMLAALDALIVRNRTQVNAELLARAPKLRAVGRLGVGLDNIDVVACTGRGVAVFPATGANALTVAEYVVCTAMMLLRGAYLASAAVAAGKWPRVQLGEGREAAGKTLGIVGFGHTGRRTAQLAQALGLRVLATDPLLAAESPVWREFGVARCTLDDLLAKSDAVTLHVPLTNETRHLIDAERIARMKKGAVLVNAARGGVVDEAALVAALKSAHLAGAALDVFESEPLRAGSPLADAPNLLLTPHVAGITRESNVRVSTMIAEQVAAALARV
jgi:(S)-sulfolactate dehydrogenase